MALLRRHPAGTWMVCKTARVPTREAWGQTLYWGWEGSLDDETAARVLRELLGSRILCAPCDLGTGRSCRLVHCRRNRRCGVVSPVSTRSRWGAGPKLKWA